MNLFKTTQPKLIDWLLYGIVIFTCWIIFLYYDIYITTLNGINIWNSTPFNFYSYGLEFHNGDMNSHPTYSYILFLIFGIWNFPIWLIMKLDGVPIIVGSTYLYWLWAKLLIVLTTLYTGSLVYKIAKQFDLSSNTAKWCAFIFLTSPVTIITSDILSRYDLFTILFSLLGIISLQKKNMKLFVFWFAIAMCMREFSFIIFFPLLLLEEKRLDKILLYSLGVVSIAVILFLFFKIVDPAYGLSGLNNDASGTFNLLFTNGVISGSLNYALFFVFWSVFNYYVLNKKTIDHTERNILLMWLPLLSLSIFFVFFQFRFYWWSLFVPFMSILIMQYKDKSKLLLLLTLGAELGVVLTVISRHWGFSLQDIYGLGLFNKIFNISGQPYQTLYSILPKGGTFLYPQIWIVGMILFLLSTFPNNKVSITTFEVLPTRLIALSRLGISIIIIGAYLFCYFYTGALIGTQ